MAREPQPLRRARPLALALLLSAVAPAAWAAPPSLLRAAATSTSGAHPGVEAELFGAPAPGARVDPAAERFRAPEAAADPPRPDRPGAEAPGEGAHPGVEAELFGGASAVGEGRAEAVRAGPREAPSGEDEPGAVGRAAPSELLGDLRSTLEAASDRLAIGGNLFLRLEYRALAEGDAGRFALVSPSTLDLYLDARPVDRVRTYVRARLAYDATVVEGDGTSAADLTNPADAPNASALTGGFGRDRTQVLLDQLWVKFDVARRVFFTVGKQRVRWGTGRIWNPTDFLNAQRFDPLALFDQRLGVGLVKAHVPFEDLGANLYAVVDFDRADQLDRLGAAVRAEVAFEKTEIALSGSLRKDEPYRLGADLSTGLGPFELRAELALLADVRAPFFEGRWSADAPLELSGLSARYRDQEVIPQLVLGGDITLDYGDGDQAIVGLEYFFNDAGYGGADLYPVLLLAPGLSRDEQIGGLVNETLGLREPAPSLFQPLYLGRHYVSAFALLPTPFGLEDHTFTLTGIANLSDRSGIARIDHSLRLFRFLSLRSYLNVHLGDRGEFRFGLELGEVPGSPEGGLRVVPPAFELGLALNATL